MTGIDKQNAVGMVEHLIVLAVGCEVDLRTGGDSLGHKLTGGTSAKSHATDGHVGHRQAVAEGNRSENRLDELKESHRLHRLGEIAYRAQPLLRTRAGGHEHLHVGEAEHTGHTARDTAYGSIQSSMRRIDADAGLNGLGEDHLRTIAAGHALHSVKQQRMVSNDEITATGNSLVDHIGGCIDAEQRSGGLGTDIANLQAGIVVALLQMQGSYAFY